MKKVLAIAVFCFISFLFSMSTVYAEEGKKVKLGWEAKYTHCYTGYCRSNQKREEQVLLAVKFLSAQIKNGKLIFDILVHNKEKEKYMCVWFNTAKNAVHINDELGNVYKGGKFTLTPMDNKLAPNQRKRLKVVLQEPDPEAKLVNIHFGFTHRFVTSKPQERCGDSILSAEGLNFHKLDWDISVLR